MLGKTRLRRPSQAASSMIWRGRGTERGRRRKEVTPRRSVFSTALGLLVCLAAIGSSSALAANGATVTNQSFCYTATEYPGGTFCLDFKYVVKKTETPSGNVSFVTNGQTTVDESGGAFAHGCEFSHSTKFHHRYLLKDGTLHEQGDRQADRYSVTCPGPAPNTLTCTYTLHAHYANGSLQFNRPDVTCVQT